MTEHELDRRRACERRDSDEHVPLSPRVVDNGAERAWQKMQALHLAEGIECS
jgi:hypothetical protein